MPKTSKVDSAATNSVITRGRKKRLLNALPDTVDFRDLLYVPTLVDVPCARTLEEYRAFKIPVLDQGTEGACTGFALATVAHYLLRSRRNHPVETMISPYMFYDLARRYDEWPGEDYSGSSCRGAIKAWYKHGVCRADLWRWGGTKPGVITEEVTRDAARQPIGAYFRVNNKDLVAMHAALAEVGILYASALVHEGWSSPGKNGRIPFRSEMLGGHAFAIVGYDEQGFWIQNSWGEDWGLNGYGHVRYDDWLQNGSDVWVARLGVAVELGHAPGFGASGWQRDSRSMAVLQHEVRPHVITIANDGSLDSRGDFACTPASVREIFEQDFRRMTAGWKRKRLVLYAHGGLVPADDAIARVAKWRKAMLDSECYLVSFIWKSDFITTVKNLLLDAFKGARSSGFLDGAKDFLLDKADATLEPVARRLGGKTLWDEMKENALLATTRADGGARVVAREILKLAQDPDFELHIVGHSAGSVFHAPLLSLLSSKGKCSYAGLGRTEGFGIPATTVSLMAPACTVELFKSAYLPLLNTGQLRQLSLFLLSDQAEQDDSCATLYNKSLLYLVSNAFEATSRNWWRGRDGTPILGMEKFLKADPVLKAMLKHANVDLMLAPNNEASGGISASGAKSHGAFDDDLPTMKAILARITGATSSIQVAGDASLSRMRVRQVTALLREVP